MKIEITNKFIKDLERALRKEVSFASYCEVQEINVTFFDSDFYTIKVAWGNNGDKKSHHYVTLCFHENDSIEYIRGQFSRVIYEFDETGEIVGE